MANNGKYINFPILADARSLMQKAWTYLQAKIPGWTPSEGQLDTWMIEAVSGEAADIATLTSEVPKTIFRYYGAKLFGIPPEDATYATCTATVYAIDTHGYTIPQGMQVGIYDQYNNLVPFTVLIEAIIPGGQDHVAVTLIAMSPGAASSGLGAISGPCTLIDILAWVDHITQNTVTNGGVDGESDDAYLDRLSLVLQTMTPTPIVASDFAILARNIAGVQRAVAIDGYNPGTMTFNNERMVAVIALDASGAPVGSGIKTAIENYLESLRETTFEVNTDDATIQQIDVSVTLIAEFGFDLTDVHDRVVAAITEYLNPVRWGISPSDNPNNPATWINTQIVGYLELATVINNVTGVDHIAGLILGAHGGSLLSADYIMTGVTPLPNPGTITVTVPS